MTAHYATVDQIIRTVHDGVDSIFDWLRESKFKLTSETEASREFFLRLITNNTK